MYWIYEEMSRNLWILTIRPIYERSSHFIRALVTCHPNHQNVLRALVHIIMSARNLLCNEMLTLTSARVVSSFTFTSARNLLADYESNT